MDGLDGALFEENERTAPQDEGRRSVALGDVRLWSGVTLPGVRAAYMTFGELNSARDNAVLVCHALSGDANCAGWWDRLIGPGKAIDTDRFFVIGTNALGGCQGTTGPGSVHPGDGRRWGSRFPEIGIEDMVRVQLRVLDHLGIERLALVAGGSMGGMQALEVTRQAPERVAKCWLTATCARHSAMQIGFNETARQAIWRDPRWAGGDYLPGDEPVDGLAVARMTGHLTYLSEAAFERKFGRERRADGVFQVASYLAYQGDKFTKRFDAGSLVALTLALDAYDGTDVSGVTAEYLVTSFTSDWIYPTWQSVELEGLLRDVGARVSRHEIHSDLGHDAFLLDDGAQADLVRRFLA